MAALSTTTGEALTVAVQYPSLGPYHNARLRAIARQAPHAGWRVVAMEMFREDSDYGWDPVDCTGAPYARHTVMDCSSEAGRRKGRALRRSVWRSLDRIAPHVLVVNGWGHRESRASLAWAGRRGCPTVLLSDSPRDNVRRRWWKEAAKRWLVRNCRSAFVAGRPQARYAEALGIPADRIHHPGSCVVDNDLWRAAARSVRSDPDGARARAGLPHRYFLTIARFLDWKNLPFLVEAYARYRAAAGPDPHDLVLCGDGPERTRIEQTLRRLRVPGVHLRGWLPQDALAPCYALASSFVLPSSRFECWGLVVNEAMACGLPVLVSRACGCAEDLVRDGCNGYAFDPADAARLADRMLQLGSDGALRRRMGAASLRMIDAYSPAVAARNFWLAVEAALGARAAPLPVRRPRAA